MSDSYHPRLAEIEQKLNEPIQPPAEEPDDGQETQAPVADVQPEAVQPPVAEQEAEVDASVGQEQQGEPVEIPTNPQPDDSQFYVKLDKRSLYSELRRLDQDPETSDTFRSFVGRKMKREYEGQLELLRAERDALNAQLESERTQREIATMLAEEGEAAVQERLRTDRDFAQRYHNTGQQTIDLDSVRSQVQLSGTVENMFEEALGGGLPLQRIQQYQAAIEQGYFDYPRDAQGNATGGALDPTQSLLWIQRSLQNEVMAYRAAAMQQAQRQAPPQAAPPPPPPPQAAAPVPERKPAANPALRGKGPDVSSGSSGSLGGQMTVDEYKRLTPPEKLERFPGKDLQQLIDERIVVRT